MNWNQIRTKTMLIEERKRSMTKIDKKRILNSIRDFTIRLREIKRNGGNYTHQVKYNMVCKIQRASS